MSKRSRANRLASSPPSAPRISMITARPACGSRGSSSSRSSASEPVDLGDRRVDLVLEMGALVVGGGVEQLAGHGEVALAGADREVGGDDRLELAVPLRHDAQLVEVARRAGIGQAGLELAELVGQCGKALRILGHDVDRGYRRRPPAIARSRRTRSGDAAGRPALGSPLIRSRDGVTTTRRDGCRPTSGVDASAASRASAAYGITSRSTPTEHTATTIRPSPSRPDATHGTASFRFRRATGGATGSHRRRPDRRGIVGDHPSQQALARQPVERMGGGVDSAVLLDDRHDARQRFLGRNVAVDHRERFAVVGTDPDLQSRRPGEGIVDHATDLESAHLSGEHPELLDGFGPTGLDQRR